MRKAYLVPAGTWRHRDRHRARSLGAPDTRSAQFVAWVERSETRDRRWRSFSVPGSRSAPSGLRAGPSPFRSGLHVRKEPRYAAQRFRGEGTTGKPPMRTTRCTLLAAAATIGIALALPAVAQTGSSTNPGASGAAPGRDPGTASQTNPGRSDNLPPGQQDRSTTGTGRDRGPGASEFAPGRNPGTANETNPGRSDSMPPGQRNR
jgi:hypothetical protein